MLYSEYGTDEIINELDPIEIIEIINLIYETRNEKKTWDIYLAIYPNMTSETYMSFEEFKKPKPKKNKKTKEEILDDVRLIMNSAMTERGGVV
jgi:hypothetical protein